jgi:Flp pilus assembly protein protease CpaA
VALRAGPVDVAWIAVLAVAGGHVSSLGVLLGSLVLGCGASAVVLALRRPAPPKTTIAPPDVVSRGPLTYAGPGSLGGTKSALRR